MASSIYRLGNLSPQAVAGTLCSLPLAAGMFYILSAKTGIFASRPRDYMNETSLVLLLCVVVGSWTVPCHCEFDPEATASLIPDGHVYRDAVHNRQGESINYGATTQESDTSQNYLRSRQPRRRPPMRAVSSRRLQPHSALQGIEEEVQTEGTDDIVGNDQGQSLGDEIPALRIAKLRHKVTNPKAQQEDQGEMQHIQFVDHSSDISLHGKKPFRRGEWKPDAPEFIPIAQQRIVMQQLDGNRDQQVERQQDLDLKETQHQGFDEERDLAQTVNSQMAKSAVPSFPIADENESPRPAASTKHRNHAAEGGSSQSTTGSQQASDRVIIAYPKKARKRGKRSRKEAMSRRKGTKSEPAGIGLTTDIDQS
ncbi:uncharacterized protein NFIA_067070 [Aspergillus fischeri NRRL 181]|uniref:Uncharacterized protein n=1 Tax=Neosartorya fischeri (strain ATCC 1020 / DSM 3700 / CBS 544.65 / FGSC A1164 / JCM 1740 / NRRL 181 / WB 181) TaxID=331117 RepID=A1D746_NEOFI|nr:conserved hypothetical protein [Aspergillus fischeri NRRL 181]EAW21540.1 conserved hypothetical protein [Aspergillus fischeri NRRL 181]